MNVHFMLIVFSDLPGTNIPPTRMAFPKACDASARPGKISLVIGVLREGRTAFRCEIVSGAALLMGC
jgi:hypothetical protein